MFSVLNRLRGMFTWARALIAIATGIFSYFIIFSITGSSIVAVMNFIPLTSGWGCWDCIAMNRSSKKPNPYSEGWLGVQKIAEFIYSSDKDWLTHCRVALVIDGMFRASWILVFMFYMDVQTVMPYFIFMSFSFLIASELGYYTTKLFNFKYMTGGWEHQEVWYGFIQGVILILLQRV